jgi:hypothetical protein
MPSFQETVAQLPLPEGKNGGKMHAGDGRIIVANGPAHSHRQA